MLTCEQVYERASAFHDGELGPEDRVEYERHLELCPSCDNFYRSLEVTVRRAREALTVEAPPELTEEMVRAVRARLGRSA